MTLPPIHPLSSVRIPDAPLAEGMGVTNPFPSNKSAGGLLSRITIRTRLIVLASALLAILVVTNLYLTGRLTTNSAGMVQAAELLQTIEQANSAQIAFGEVRYWMTDLAVSLLNLSETNAKAAHQRMERHLDKLAPLK